MESVPTLQRPLPKHRPSLQAEERVSRELVMTVLNDVMPGMNWKDDGRGLTTDASLTFHAAESLAQFITLNTHIRNVALHKNTHNNAYGLKIFTPMGLDFLYTSLQNLTSPNLRKRLSSSIQMALSLSNQYFMQRALQ